MLERIEKELFNTGIYVTVSSGYESTRIKLDEGPVLYWSKPLEDLTSSDVNQIIDWVTRKYIQFKYESTNYEESTTSICSDLAISVLRSNCGAGI